eukprot:13452695-Ditylum_brightwellii.AAC.2
MSFWIPNILYLEKFSNINEDTWENVHDSNGNKGPFFGAVNDEGYKTYAEGTLVKEIANMSATATGESYMDVSSAIDHFFLIQKEANDKF